MPQRSDTFINQKRLIPLGLHPYFSVLKRLNKRDKMNFSLMKNGKYLRQFQKKPIFNAFEFDFFLSIYNKQLLLSKLNN